MTDPTNNPQPIPSTNPESGAENKSLWQKLGPAGFLGVAWAFFPAIFGFLLLGNLGTASDWLLEHRTTGIIVYIVIFMITAGLGLLPTYAQAILGGWVFGITQGIPAALAGFTGGALIGYFVARLVAHDRVQLVIEENIKARAVRNALIGRGFWRTLGIITLIRVPPNSPFALTNGLFATSGVKLLPYTIGTMVGMLPRTAIAVAFAAAGAEQGRDIQSILKKDPMILIIGAIVMLIVLMILGYIGNRAIQRVVGIPDETASPASDTTE